MLYTQDGVEFEKLLSLHKCTQKDWDEFSPPAPGMEDAMQRIKENPERGMYCFDSAEFDDKEIYGDEKNQNNGRVNIVLVPCNFIHSSLGET